MGQDERDAGGQGRLYVAEGSRPFDFGEWRVDGDELVGRNVSGQQDGHGLRVLAARVIDGDEGAAVYEVAAGAGDGNGGGVLVRRRRRCGFVAAGHEAMRRR